METVKELFGEFLAKGNVPDDWGELRKNMEYNDMIISDFENVENVRNDQLTNGYYRCGHVIRRDSPNGNITWTSWTAEDGRVQKNSVVVLDSKIEEILHMGVNCFAMGWIYDKDPEYISDFLEELLDNDTYTWDSVTKI